MQELPPLASERTAADFHVGQGALLLVDGELHDSHVNHVQETRGTHPPSAGFLRLLTPGQTPVYKTPFMIIDMGRNYVVPDDAWEMIKADPDYRERYLSSGSKESLRRRSELERAIPLRIATEAEVTIEKIKERPGRARPRGHSSQLAAWDENTGAYIVDDGSDALTASLK